MEYWDLGLLNNGFESCGKVNDGERRMVRIEIN